MLVAGLSLEHRQLRTLMPGTDGVLIDYRADMSSSIWDVSEGVFNESSCALANQCVVICCSTLRQVVVYGFLQPLLAPGGMPRHRVAVFDTDVTADVDACLDTGPSTSGAEMTKQCSIHPNTHASPAFHHTADAAQQEAGCVRGIRCVM